MSDVATTKLNNIRIACEKIRIETENDVRKFDGQEFNGKNVAAQLGNQAAAITTLADMVSTLALFVQQQNQKV